MYGTIYTRVIFALDWILNYIINVVKKILDYFSYRRRRLFVRNRKTVTHNFIQYTRLTYTQIAIMKSFTKLCCLGENIFFITVKFLHLHKVVKCKIFIMTFEKCLFSFKFIDFHQQTFYSIFSFKHLRFSLKITISASMHVTCAF